MLRCCFLGAGGRAGEQQHEVTLLSPLSSQLELDCYSFLLFFCVRRVNKIIKSLK